MRARRVLGAIAAALLVFPATAEAHAVLERTIPERGAELATAPEQVAFFFSEPVESAFGALRVYDSDANEVQAGQVMRPDGDPNAIATALQPDLPDGTYTATFRVVSADSHPVSGGFVFSIGSPGAGGPPLSELLDEQAGTGGAGSAAFVVDRLAAYWATALLVGGLVFLLGVSRPIAAASGRERAGALVAADQRLLGIGIAASVVGLAATLISLPLQVSSAAGVSFTDSLSPDYAGEILSTRFGAVEVLRAGAFALLIPLLAMARARRLDRSALAVAAALPAAILLLAPALSGHASTQEPTWLLVPLNVLHVAAMAIWLGGIAAMLAALPAATSLLAAERRSGLLLAVLERFSPIALGCVVALALSGVVQAIVEVDGFVALLESAFGRAIVVKAVVLAALVGLGYANRRRLIPAIARRTAAHRPAGAPGRRLRSNLRLEALGIGVALVAAAIMVGYAPPSTAAAGPASGSVTVGANYLEYTVEPASVGSNEVHLYLFASDDGRQVSPKGLTATAHLDSAGVGPLRIDLREAGPGHYVAPRADFGIAGEWTLDISIRTSRFDQDEVEIAVPID